MSVLLFAVEVIKNLLAHRYMTMFSNSQKTIADAFNNRYRRE